MKIKIRQPQWFSEIGRKDNQEDYLWPNPTEATAEDNIFVMCDGMGGHEKGEVASATAATALGTRLTKIGQTHEVITKEDFNEALSYAYDMLDEADGSEAVRRMGTTMTCLVLHGGGALVAHIGDSRIYHIRPALAGKDRSGIVYQTTDHSLVNDLLRAGEITEDEVADFPQKNVITRAMQPHLERRYKADIYNIDDIKAGDYFFLCSDGVLEQLTNEMLGQILANATLDDSGKIEAIKAVSYGKTRDNYTCWLIPIDSVTAEATDEKSNDEEYAEAEICSIAEAEVQQEESGECRIATSVKSEAQQKPKKESLFTAFFRTIFGQSDGE